MGHQNCQFLRCLINNEEEGEDDDEEEEKKKKKKKKKKKIIDRQSKAWSRSNACFTLSTRTLQQNMIKIKLRHQ